jgi:hypothetical protein
MSQTLTHAWASVNDSSIVPIIWDDSVYETGVLYISYLERIYTHKQYIQIEWFITPWTWAFIDKDT